MCEPMNPAPPVTSARMAGSSLGGAEECKQAIASPASVRPSMTRLAICHVLWSVELGGAERVVLDLAKVQGAAGHRVAVVTLSNPDGALANELRRVVDT